jgi:hypothetical protein
MEMKLKENGLMALIALFVSSTSYAAEAPITKARD